MQLLSILPCMPALSAISCRWYLNVHFELLVLCNEAVMEYYIIIILQYLNVLKCISDYNMMGWDAVSQ